MNNSRCYLIFLVLALFVIIICLLRLPPSADDGISPESTSERKISCEKSYHFKNFFFADKPHLIFAHVPKTSGTSLRAVAQEMAREKGWKDRSFYAGEPSYKKEGNLPKFLYGHEVSSMLGKLDGMNYTFAMIRKPFSRAISGYKHHLRDALARKEQNLSFATFFTPQNYVRYCNRHWTILFGEEWLQRYENVSSVWIEEFLHRATSSYLLLLLYERRVDAFALLGQAFRAERNSPNSLPYDPCEKARFTRNMGLGEANLPDALTQISLAQLRQLEDCNRLDFALYQHAERQFEQLMKYLKYTCKS